MTSYLISGYYLFKNALFGWRFPVGISVDVTNRCNLSCRHCYFNQQVQSEELDDRQMLERVKQIKREYPSIIHATWVGGEPLLRKGVVGEGMKLFPFNMVVTNGCIELPKWKNCVFNVSVDGTKEYHERMRGADTYDSTKKHADRDDVHVNLACVLTNENYYCIEDMLIEWKDTRVGGINFDFYTPIRGIDEELWIDWNRRNRIVDKLLSLRMRYGDFILNSVPVLELMKSESSRTITSDCILPKAVICLDALGRRKLPCVIGNKADCSRCGCVIPFQIESVIVRKQLSSFTVTRRLFT